MTRTSTPQINRKAESSNHQFDLFVFLIGTRELFNAYKFQMASYLSQVRRDEQPLSLSLSLILHPSMRWISNTFDGNQTSDTEDIGGWRILAFMVYLQVNPHFPNLCVDFCIH